MFVNSHSLSVTLFSHHAMNAEQVKFNKRRMKVTACTVWPVY